MGKAFRSDVSTSELLYMREHEKMSNRAIAKALDMSYNSILYRIGRQPKELRVCPVEREKIVQAEPNKDEVIMRRIAEHLAAYKERYHNEWVGIFLQGSQNYGLDHEGSDVDTKIIVLPTFEDIVMSRPPISTTMVLPNDEHCDVKDIRLMFACLKKQNINFLEILFTRYKLINPVYADLFSPVIDQREAVAHYNNYAFVSCATGMIIEKFKAMEKPHPSVQHIIAKYGYDGKQLHHIERVFEFLKRFALNGEPFENCLLSGQREYLVALKRNLLPKERAVQIADLVMNQAIELKEKYMKETALSVDRSVDALFDTAMKNILRKSFTREFAETEGKAA